MPGRLTSPRYIQDEVERAAPSLIDLLAFASKQRTLRPPASAIRAAFGVSELTYQALLIRAIDDPVAWAIAPDLMSKLKARRDRNRGRRALVTRGGNRDA